jgi:hypothetical protein
MEAHCLPRFLYAQSVTTLHKSLCGNRTRPAVILTDNVKLFFSDVAAFFNSHQQEKTMSVSLDLHWTLIFPNLLKLCIELYPTFCSMNTFMSHSYFLPDNTCATYQGPNGPCPGSKGGHVNKPYLTAPKTGCTAWTPSNSSWEWMLWTLPNTFMVGNLVTV